VLAGEGFQKVRFKRPSQWGEIRFYSGKNNISLEEFDMSAAATEYTMVPVIGGAKPAGMLQIVIGALALVAVFLIACATFAVFAGISAVAATTTAQVGIGLNDDWRRGADAHATAQF
jgi:predicted phage tail protein